MADGSIVIDARIDDKQAQAELNRLAKRIDSLNAKIMQAQDARFPLAERADELAVKLDLAKAKLEEMLNASSGTYTANQVAHQKEDVKALQAQWNEAQSQVERYNRTIERTTVEWEAAQAKAGQLSTQLAGIKPAGQKAAGGIDLANTAVGKLERRIVGLAKRVFVFSMITMALRSLRTGLMNAVKSNNEASVAIGRLKGALLTLAQPILNAVIPAFTAFINVLTRVVSAIAAVVSALFGTTAQASAEAAESLYDEQNALDGVGGAAKKASKQLAGFDEIQKLTADDAGGGGGGGTARAIAPLFDAVKEFELPMGLKIAIDDVLFDWEDLTGEQIAEKVIAGLTGLAGAVIGFAIGGVPGALVGTLAGLVLGIAIDSVIFNHDGKLDGEEIARACLTAAFAAAGGILGFALGGWWGAGIGITLGAILAIELSKSMFDFDGTLSSKELINAIITGASLAGGLVLSAMAGGGILGITIVSSITIAVSHITANWDSIVRMWKKFFTGDFAGAMLEAMNQTGPLVSFTKSVVDWIFGEGTWDNAKAVLKQHGADIINGLIKGMYDALPDPLIWWGDNVVLPFCRAIEQLFGIASPSKVFHEYGGYIIEGLKYGIIESFVGIFDWTKLIIFDPFVSGFKAIFGITGNESLVMSAQGEAIGGGILRGILIPFSVIDAWINENIFAPFMNGIRTVFGIDENESSVMNEAGAALGEGFANGISSGIQSVKNVMNDIIGIVETAVNWIIDKVNSLSINIPDWVPGAGGKRLGFSVPQISIPRLAQGAVIPPNREFLAVLGDQTSGRNIEAPEAALQAMAAQAASANAAYLERIISILQEGKVLVVDDTTFARLVYDTNRSEISRHGGTLINVGGRA